MPYALTSSFERIHSTTSPSTHATAFLEIRRCLGKPPSRSRRQIVERERPVCALTAGNRRKRMGRADGSAAADPDMCPTSDRTPFGGKTLQARPEKSSTYDRTPSEMET